MVSFRLLRYVPDSARDEFINIGVLVLGAEGRFAGRRMANDEDLRRLRCLHPAADVGLLRAWQSQIEREMDQAAAEDRIAETGALLAALDHEGSLSLRWTPAAAFESEDAAAAAQQLYERLVASPPRAAAHARAGTASWVKYQADSVFRAAGLLERFEAGVFA